MADPIPIPLAALASPSARAEATSPAIDPAGKEEGDCMITGELKAKVDSIWDTMWSGASPIRSR